MKHLYKYHATRSPKGLVKRAKSIGIVDRTNVAIDSTKIDYNSRLKEHLNAHNLCSSSIRKAKIITLLNYITLISGTIAINQKSNDLKNVA